MALGVFPEVTLVQARSRRNAARATLQGGADPLQLRKAGTAEELRASQGTFGAVCADWLAFKAKA